MVADSISASFTGRKEICDKLNKVTLLGLPTAPFPEIDRCEKQSALVCDFVGLNVKLKQ